MNMITNPLTLSAAALALFLAGCGGSDDNGADDRPPTCTGGQVLNDAGNACVDRMDQISSDTDVSAALVNATAALNTLAGAADADGSALKMAMDAHEKVTFAISQGVSMSAQTSAQGVLDAAGDLRTAIETATTARANAQTAYNGLSAGAAKTALKNLIDRADMAIKDANALVRTAPPGGALNTETARYTGDDKTPADQGQYVAAAVQGITSMTSGTLPTGPDSNVFAAGNTRNPETMRTFAEWFAGDLVDTLREGKAVKAISVEKMTVPVGGAVIGDAGTDAGDSGYLGIAGHFICRGEDCAPAVAGDPFGKGWHFTPTDANAYWEINGGAYEEASFAEWGLWLTSTARDTTDGPYAAAAVNYSQTDVGSDLKYDKSDDDERTTASYNGSATGLSSRQTGTGDDATFASGHFNARVDLMATFTDTASLDGSIHTFTAVPGQGTGHVDSAWRFNLTANSGVSAGVFEQTTGAYDDRNVGGSWNLAPYGESGKHPTGFYGRFHAMEANKYNVFGTVHADK